MATLETRISALEGGRAGADDVLCPKTIYIVGMGPGGIECEAVTVAYRGEVWRRQPGESGQDLKRRAAAEVKRDRPGQVVIMAANI